MKQNRRYLNFICVIVSCLLQLSTLPSIAQNIPDYLPEEGLNGWWPFNGNAQDESGQANHGTVNGASPVIDRFGNSNAAFSFDGIDDLITCLQPGPIGTSDRSVSFWLNVDSIDSFSDNCILSYGSSLSDGQGQIFALNYNAVMCNGYSIGFGGNMKKYSSVEEDYNQWVHHTFVLDTTNIYSVKYYQNGLLVSGGCFSSPDIYPMNTGDAFPLTFGRVHDTSVENENYYFKGKLDDIAVWNRTLSDEEVFNMYTGSATALYEKKDFSGMILSPNPTGERMMVRLQSDSGNGEVWKICDSRGRLVIQGIFTEQVQEIDLSGIESGLYFFSCEAIDPLPVKFIRR